MLQRSPTGDGGAAFLSAMAMPMVNPYLIRTLPIFGDRGITDGNMEIEHSDPLSARIIQCIIKVHQTLGPGFVEVVYKRALLIELRRQNLRYEVEKEVFVFYEGVKVGGHVIDIVVEGQLILELKVVEKLNKVHYAQVKSYMKATGLRIALLVNFAGELADYRRVRSPLSP